MELTGTETRTSVRQDFGSLLTDEQWRSVVRRGRPRNYIRGETIMHQGEPGTTVHLLVDGMVKIVVVRPDGSEVPLAFRGPGELLGESSIWASRIRSATVVAGLPTETRVFTSERFRDHVRRTGLEPAVWQTVLARQRESDEMRAEQSALSGRCRLATALLRLTQTLGEPIAPAIRDTTGREVKGSLLAIALSQQEIADHIGLSRTSVALEYTRLKQLGIIRIGRNYVAVHDRAALAAIAHGTE